MRKPDPMNSTGSTTAILDSSVLYTTAAPTPILIFSQDPRSLTIDFNTLHFALA
jgi:hypothetical protein